MKDSILLGLIQNASILLAFSLIYDYFWVRNVYNRSVIFKMLSGVFLGLVGIVLILSPWTFLPGIFFDTRSVLLTISGLFLGPIPTIIAIIIISVYRAFLGGAGIWMGVAVIVSSGMIGVLWNFFRPKWRRNHQIIELAVLGVVVHGVMLGCTVFLPEGNRNETFFNLLVPVTTIYPLATVLLGLMMLRQAENWKNKAALDASEKRWSFALDGSGSGVWDWNPSTNAVFFSKQWKLMLGYQDFEIANNFDEWDRLLNPEDRDRVYKQLEMFLAGDVPLFEVEQRLLCKDGSYKWILSRGKVMVRDDEGNPIRCIGTHKDIAERKEREEQLNKERFLVDALMKYTPENIFFKDLNSRFIRVNQSSARVLGYEDASLLIGKSDFDLFDRDYAEKTIKDEQEIIRTGKSLIEEGKGININGEEVWTLTNKMILPNPDGEIIGTYGFSVDITLQKKVEQALKESEEYTNSILSALPHMIFVIESDGVCVDFRSGSTVDLFVPIETFLNKCLYDVMPERVVELFRNGIESVLVSKTIQSVEYVLHLNSGINNFECSFIPFGESKVIALVKNISVRKKVEEALRDSQAQLKNFAAHLQNIREEERVLLAREIHDELGQILIALKIDLGLLKHNVVKDFVNKDDVEDQFGQVMELLDRTIKTTRKIMTGLRPEVLELVGFVEAVKLYANDFKERHKINCTFRSDVTNFDVNSDKSVALFRILQEALSNVVKHAYASEVKINFSQESGNVILQIIDNGIGIVSNQKNRNDSYGLIGMRERVLLLDGKLSIFGEKDKGTVVKVEMPFVENSYI